MNDSPVDCQNHGVTEPQREGTALAVEGYKNVDNYYIFSIFLSQKESLSHLTVTAPFRQGSLIFTQSNSAINYQFSSELEIYGRLLLEELKPFRAEFAVQRLRRQAVVRCSRFSGVSKVSGFMVTELKLLHLIRQRS